MRFIFLDLGPQEASARKVVVNRPSVGMRWQDRLFVDACLPFGLRSAPKIFNATADALEWIIANESRDFGEFVLHYLDDFLFGGSPGSDTCRRSLDLALHICERLGFPVMSEKVFGPSTQMEVLGFVLDTAAMEIRLPQEKLHHLKSLLWAWIPRKSCSKVGALITDWKLAACKCCGQTWSGVSLEDD